MTGPDLAAPGAEVVDAGGRRLGTVDAVFADYLLIRTASLLPVDLYVPVTAIRRDEEADRLLVEADNAAVAYDRWHRPLKAAPHD